MARRIPSRNEASVELVERDAYSELELRNVVRQAPNLIPVDDLGLDRPMMVVGRMPGRPKC